MQTSSSNAQPEPPKGGRGKYMKAVLADPFSLNFFLIFLRFWAKAGPVFVSH